MSISGGLFEKLSFTLQIEYFSKILSKIPNFDTAKIDSFSNINDLKIKYLHYYVPKSVQNEFKSALTSKLGHRKFTDLIPFTHCVREGSFGQFYPNTT